MNAGDDRQKALARAQALAMTDGKPRYVLRYHGTYWVEKSRLGPGAMAGMFSSDHCVVYHDGHYKSYDPTSHVDPEDQDDLGPESVA